MLLARVFSHFARRLSRPGGKKESSWDPAEILFSRLAVCKCEGSGFEFDEGEICRETFLYRLLGENWVVGLASNYS